MLILGWELPGLIKKKQYKELFVFLLLWFFASLYAVLNLIGINIFDPIGWIIIIVEHLDMNSIIDQILKLVNI